MRPAMAPKRQICPERIPDFSTVFTVPIHRRKAPCMRGEMRLVSPGGATTATMKVCTLYGICDSIILDGNVNINSTGRCRMCNQPSISAWINTRSGIRKGIRLPISGSEPAQHMFARKQQGVDVHTRPSAASLSGSCSVAMREMLYAEVDLTGAEFDASNASFASRCIVFTERYHTKTGKSKTRTDHGNGSNGCKNAHHRRE